MNKERTMSGSTVGLQRRKDEEKTNYERTNDKFKLRI